MDAVVNLIQNYQAYVIFFKVPIRSKKYLLFLCSGQPKARKTLEKMALVERVALCGPPQGLL